MVLKENWILQPHPTISTSTILPARWLQLYKRPQPAWDRLNKWRQSFSHSKLLKKIKGSRGLPTLGVFPLISLDLTDFMKVFFIFFVWLTYGPYFCLIQWWYSPLLIKKRVAGTSALYARLIGTGQKDNADRTHVWSCKRAPPQTGQNGPGLWFSLAICERNNSIVFKGVGMCLFLFTYGLSKTKDVNELLTDASWRP